LRANVGLRFRRSGSSNAAALAFPARTRPRTVPSVNRQVDFIQVEASQNADMLSASGRPQFLASPISPTQSSHATENTRIST